MPGPRGLIRVGVISPETESPALLNFIAVEPVVAGAGQRGDRMAFSELEPSQMDGGTSGKRLWVRGDAASPLAGVFSSSRDGRRSIERLSVRIEVEPFQANGAHVYLVASIADDHPEQLQMAVYHHQDSPRIEELTLTATMGNYERLRWLWLKNRVVDSRELYRSYRGEDFAEHGSYGLHDILRMANGDAIVFCTSNEASPQANRAFAAPEHWRYRLPRLTQYWAVPAGQVESDLRVRVNGRRVYWASHSPVANGVAFENFELRQKYRPGQVFIFGVVAKEPWAFQPAIRHLHGAKPPEAN
jgi:hypothetical protein